MGRINVEGLGVVEIAGDEPTREELNIIKKYLLNDEINIEEKLRVAKIAIQADAKLGLPKVPKILLYGLFHWTKSFPVLCINE